MIKKLSPLVDEKILKVEQNNFYDGNPTIEIIIILKAINTCKIMCILRYTYSHLYARLMNEDVGIPIYIMKI